jgi:acetoin utilization deacetylase AcuC-like enzyme
MAMGKGYTVNEPLSSGSGGADYLRVFRESLTPAIRRFRPEFILISAGFDAHCRDPLSGMLLTADDYAEMTRFVMELAAKHCDSRLVSVLEGGYDLEALAESVVAHVGVLSEES